MKYHVWFSETARYSFDVDAKNKDEAYEKAIEAINNEEVSPFNCDTEDFEIVETAI